MAVRPAAQVKPVKSPILLPPRLSPSALGRYRVCPKSFLLTDIERAPRGNEASPILVQGNAVHHALERFFGLPQEHRKPENLERALRSVWPEHRKRDAFSSRDEEASFGRGALEMLRDYGERFDLSAEPLAREQWIGLQLSGIRLYGKIDRVDRGVHGGLDLVDYKSGRRLIEASDIPQEPAVQVYLLGAEEKFQLPVERVRFIYLALQQEVIWEPEREDVEALRERLLKTLTELQADQVFEARPGDHCRFCPAALRCPDRQRVALDELVPVEALPF
jgi:RecB family exonuclease